jgi:predicted DsbA family dithiol-disulfide isomerase
VAGVPLLVFNDRFPVSGAHPPETLLEVMQLATLVLPMADSAVF